MTWPSHIQHTKNIFRDEMEKQLSGYIYADLHQSRVGMLGDPILVRLDCSTHFMHVARLSLATYEQCYNFGFQESLPRLVKEVQPVKLIWSLGSRVAVEAKSWPFNSLQVK